MEGFLRFLLFNKSQPSQALILTNEQNVHIHQQYKQDAGRAATAWNRDVFQVAAVVVSLHAARAVVRGGGAQAH
jgi:uncharacterized membrane protein